MRLTTDELKRLIRESIRQELKVYKLNEGRTDRTARPKLNKYSLKEYCELYGTNETDWIFDGEKAKVLYTMTAGDIESAVAGVELETGELWVVGLGADTEVANFEEMKKILKNSL